MIGTFYISGEKVNLSNPFGVCVICSYMLQDYQVYPISARVFCICAQGGMPQSVNRQTIETKAWNQMSNGAIQK